MASLTVTHDPGALHGVTEADVAKRPTLGQVRRRKLLSAYELGKRAGVAASTILAIEEGAQPRLSTIRKLSEALGMDPAEIDWPGDPLDLGDDGEEMSVPEA